MDACFASQSFRSPSAHVLSSKGVFPPVISSTNGIIFSPSLSGNPCPPDELFSVSFTPYPLIVFTQRQTGLRGSPFASTSACSTAWYTFSRFCPSLTGRTFQPSSANPANVGSIEKLSSEILPESFVSLSETTKINGLISLRLANPGIAAIASLASPSMQPPSEITQNVTRSRFANLSPRANPCATGIPEPNGPLLMKTPSGLRWLSP